MEGPLPIFRVENVGGDCLNFGDRFSSSIIMKEKSILFGGAGGMIFKPEYTRILCSYPGDGGTRHGGDDGCGIDPNDMGTYCDPRDGERNGWCNGLPHRPEDLDVMLRGWIVNGDYNEVVVDAAYHDEHLPASVEAILDDEDAHMRFVKYYGVSEKDHPLVHFAGGKFVARLNPRLRGLG